METCLFTGADLTPSTRKEHTIPQKLGGRIVSRVVSSTSFNAACSDYLDKVLAYRYAQIMNELAPLLSEQHKPGRLDVDAPGERPGLGVEQGVLTRTRPAVDHDEAGRPRSVVASDARAARTILRQAGWKDITTRTVPPMKGDIYYVRRIPSISVELEVAALKSALLTFDHLLCGSNMRFTRHPQLAEVRSFVRDAVAKQMPDPSGCHKFSLGMQYDRRCLYERIRQKLPLKKTPFEHVMLVAGYAADRTVDLVWLVLGFDPFGFRLCYDWNGGSFAFGFVNGVLRHTKASEAFPLDCPDTHLCGPTDLRAWPGKGITPLHQVIFAYFEKANQEAVLLRQMEADDAIWEGFGEAARSAEDHDCKVATQVKSKLRRLYARRANEDNFKTRLDAIYERHTQSYGSAILSQSFPTGASTSDIDRNAWLGVYRSCLTDLVASFGPPGELFLEKAEIVQDKGDNQQARKEGA
jgi:hypothetical protein